MEKCIGNFHIIGTIYRWCLIWTGDVPTSQSQPLSVRSCAESQCAAAALGHAACNEHRPKSANGRALANASWFKHSTAQDGDSLWFHWFNPFEMGISWDMNGNRCGINDPTIIWYMDLSETLKWQSLWKNKINLMAQWAPGMENNYNDGRTKNKTSYQDISMPRYINAETMDDYYLLEGVSGATGNASWGYYIPNRVTSKKDNHQHWIFMAHRPCCDFLCGHVAASWRLNLVHFYVTMTGGLHFSMCFLFKVRLSFFSVCGFRPKLHPVQHTARVDTFAGDYLWEVCTPHELRSFLFEVYFSRKCSAPLFLPQHSFSQLRVSWTLPG